MKRSIFLLGFFGLILFLGLPLMAGASTAAVPADRQAMTAANRLYQAGHYGEAIQLYEGLVAQGVRDSRLLYNLGNAYVRQGELARARASYESAARLAPRDPDIRANLALVRDQVGGAPSEVTAGPLAAALAAAVDFSRRWLNINELAILALGAWLLFGLLAVTYRSFPAGQRPAMLRYAAALALVVVVLAGLPLAARVFGPAGVPGVLPGAGQAALNTLSLGL
jgi:tetratricopeptide (TPR) repeat protein